MTPAHPVVEAVAALDSYGLQAGVIAVAPGPPSPEELRLVFAAGARALLLADAPPEVVGEAVLAIASGDRYLDARALPALFDLITPDPPITGDHGLTEAQLRVLRLLPTGLTTVEIAAQLGVSPHTVKSHVREILRRLGARDRAHAAAIARRRGLLHDLQTTGQTTGRS